MRSQQGFTLVELLATMLVLLIVFGAAVTFLEVSSRSQRATGSRSDALANQQVGLERMLREVRQASSPVTVTAQRVDFARAAALTAAGLPGASTTKVSWQCASSGTCYRAQVASTATLPDCTLVTPPAGCAPQITGVSSFALSPIGSNPAAITVQASFTAGPGSSPFQVNDGVELRNLG